MKKKVLDILERTAWTAAEAGLGYAAVHVANLDTVYAIPIATACAALKSWISTKFGNKESASSVPGI